MLASQMFVHVGSREVTATYTAIFRFRNTLYMHAIPPFTGGASASPYGKIAWVRATTTSAWASSGSWNSDYAIIELASSPGVGWMSFGYHSGINSGWSMNMNGYPGSTLWGKMYRMLNNIYALLLPAPDINTHIKM
jgi:hypothetical protein